MGPIWADGIEKSAGSRQLATLSVPDADTHPTTADDHDSKQTDTEPLAGTA